MSGTGLYGLPGLQYELPIKGYKRIEVGHVGKLSYQGSFQTSMAAN